MTYSYAAEQRKKIVRGSFRKVSEDILELRRSVNDVAIRLVAWMVLGIFLVGGAVNDIQAQRPAYYTFMSLIFGGSSAVATSFNPDRVIRPLYERDQKSAREFIEKGHTRYEKYLETYEEYKKSFLEQWPQYIYRGYIQILWWCFLLYVLFKPRIKPLRIDRALGIVYCQAWGKLWLEKQLSDDLLTALTLHEGVIPHSGALNKGSLLSWRVSLARYPDKGDHKDKMLERFFDLGVWPPLGTPKEPQLQRLLLPQIVDDFIHFRDNPLLAEIDHKYHTPFFIRWWLNLSLFGFLRTDRYAKKRTEKKLTEQLAGKKRWDQSEEGQNRARVIAQVKKQRSTPPEEDPFAKLFHDPVPFGKAANDSDHNQPGKYD